MTWTKADVRGGLEKRAQTLQVTSSNTDSVAVAADDDGVLCVRRYIRLFDLNASTKSKGGTIIV
jgi:hypothetical protein